jgi:galactose oxidase
VAASATAGSVITIDTDRPVVEWVLVRLASVTHTLNTDQRRVKLSYASPNVRNRYKATIPADRGVVLPGDWMLFALNAKGVPSVAKTIRIQ